MSDFERGKFFGKKKYHSRSDRSDSKSGYGSRFFNKSVYNPDKDGKEQENDVKLRKQPQILIKTREKTEERSVSPKRTKDNDVTIVQREAGGSAATASSSSSETHSSPSIKQMKASVKLLEDGILYAENVQDYLNELSEFLVVGVIGPQGVGKSTVMNLLATDLITKNTKKELFKQVRRDSDDDGLRLLSDSMSKLNTEDIKGHVFKQASIENIESCVNATNGIDMYITSNRVILLDCQPYLSISVFDELMRSGETKRSNIIGDFPPLENVGEMQGLQHIAFLMSVCHVLILVQDFFLDTNNIRYLHTAEMLKPTISNNEEEYIEQFPHLMLLHNRAQMEDFTPSKLIKMQQMYKQMLDGSKMHLESSMGLGTGKIMKTLNPDVCGDPINLFLLPEYDETTESMYQGHPRFEELVKRLKMNVNCVTKYPITHVQLTEKTWLVYCSKVWDHVKKSSFYVEYTKLMP